VIDGDDMGGGNELVGVDGEMIGEGAGIGAVFHQRGNRGEAELFIVAGLAWMAQGAKEREAEE
jgi:hypothetical protein